MVEAAVCSMVTVVEYHEQLMAEPEQPRKQQNRQNKRHLSFVTLLVNLTDEMAQRECEAPAIVSLQQFVCSGERRSVGSSSRGSAKRLLFI